MSDLREALRKLVYRIRQRSTNKLHNREFAMTLDDCVRELAALSAQPQPEAVEADQIQRAMDMLGDVPGNTILERVERIVSYYLALQCELEKVRAVSPLAPDERMRKALERIKSLCDVEDHPFTRLAGIFNLANETLSGAGDNHARDGKEPDGLCHCSWGCVEADNCRRREARKQAEEKPVKPGPSDPTPPDATAQREAIAQWLFWRFMRGHARWEDMADPHKDDWRKDADAILALEPRAGG